MAYVYSYVELPEGYVGYQRVMGIQKQLFHPILGDRCMIATRLINLPNLTS